MIYVCWFAVGKTTFTESHRQVSDDVDIKRSGSAEAAVTDAIASEKQFVFLPTHPDILEILGAKNISFTLIVPHNIDKNEWIDRHIKRGDTEEYIEIDRQGWTEVQKLATKLEKENRVIRIHPNESLDDLLPKEE